MTEQTITSRDNELIRRCAELLRSSSARRTQGMFLCEGPVLLAEALRSGARVTRVFCLPEKLPSLPPLPCPVHPVSLPVLKKLSDVETPQGVVFLCALPEERPLGNGPLLALDEVRDPGNLGTILRTADAFGAAGVLLLGDCADPFAPKVVRATMGSLFRVPLRRCAADELSVLAKGPVLAAVLDEDSRPIAEVSLKNACVVIGNEAHGVSRQVRSLCSGGVNIPIRGAESLNAAVAASIFLYEMARQNA